MRRAGLVLLSVLLVLAIPMPALGLLPNPWAAVGRLDIAGKRFCTGTVIAERSVLTAAHCLFEPDTARVIPLSNIVFQVGLRGREVVRRLTPRAVRFVEGYLPLQADRLSVLERDLAVLEFAEPLGATPLELHPGRTGYAEPLSTVRYGRSRPHRVTVDHGCRLRFKLGRLWQTSCPGEQGNSGAPLLVPSERGPRIAAVVVAVRTDSRRSWLLAAPLDGGRVLPDG